MPTTPFLMCCGRTACYRELDTWNATPTILCWPYLMIWRLPESSSSLPSHWVVWDSAWCGWEQAHKFCAHERKKSKVNFVSGILFIIAAVLVLMPLRLTTYAIFSHFHRPFQANSQTWYLSWMHFEETRNPSQSKCMYVNLCYSLYFIFTKESYYFFW